MNTKCTVSPRKATVGLVQQTVCRYWGMKLEQSTASHYCAFARAGSYLFTICFIHLHSFAVGLKVRAEGT